MPNTRRLADYVPLHRGHNTTFSVYVSPTACNVVGGCTHAENQMTIDLVDPVEGHVADGLYFTNGVSLEDVQVLVRSGMRCSSSPLLTRAEAQVAQAMKLSTAFPQLVDSPVTGVQVLPGGAQRAASTGGPARGAQPQRAGVLWHRAGQAECGAVHISQRCKQRRV